MYADFRDFAFYRMHIERAHLVAGFGRILWVDGAEVLMAPCLRWPRRKPPSSSTPTRTIATCSSCTRGNSWSATGTARLMTGIDREGCAISAWIIAPRGSGSTSHRGPEAARAALVGLARRARDRLAGAS
jgi:heme iron utilization protein